MKAYIVVTALKPEEWRGSQKYDLCVQRCRVCGSKIFSHMSIVFRDVPRYYLSMINLDQEIFRIDVRGAKEIVFESLQAPRPQGFLGFATVEGHNSWYTQWNAPEMSYYALDKRVDPEALYRAAVEYARSNRVYAWGWAKQAAYCPCAPCVRCTCSTETTDSSTNCVGAVMSVVAGALDRRALFDRAHAVRVLGLNRSAPELLFPSEALAALQAMTLPLVPLTPWCVKVLKGRRADAASGLTPLLLLMDR